MKSPSEPLRGKAHKHESEEAKRNADKKNVSAQLIEIMKKHEIDEFDIKDGQICYSKKHVKKPITKKMLTNILSKYFKGDTEKANEMNDYILENREEVVKETIVRKVNS